MPSPFPGMDPYLESPDWFPDLHGSLITFMKDFFVYPINLPDQLPEIAIPLLPGDADVSLDLQAVFDRSYDFGPYRREIEYAQIPSSHD